MTIPVRVRLDLAEFRALVRGREVVVATQDDTSAIKIEVRIILADIGFALMLAEIDAAMNDTDPRSS